MIANTKNTTVGTEITPLYIDKFEDFMKASCLQKHIFKECINLHYVALIWSLFETAVMKLLLRL